ncbi:hypothetical protein ACIQTX_16975 [Microbacterium sp. NPDC090281]|uniref:hypothetical protein n=1 Tax=Microbacterium sp. NPDC090281 TaxID=3364208 RepID=UPI003814D9FE
MRVTTFTETMRGTVAPASPTGRSGQESLTALVADHERATRSGDAGPLLLLDLRMRLPEPQGAKDGFRGDVRGGRIVAPGFEGAVTAGKADILIHDGERRIMRYRLRARSAEGRELVVVGTKYLRRGLTGVWGDTTTLYVDVYDGDVDMDDGGELEQVEPIMVGIVHVLPRDLVGQMLSLRGRPLGFGCDFVRRVIPHRVRR